MNRLKSRTMRGMGCVGVMAAVILSAGPASAHHSTALYDFQKSATVQGTVKSFQWANPHNYLQVIVPGGGGKTTEWSIEAGTPATATRQGFSKQIFKPGDKVNLIVAPMRDGSPGGTLKTAIFADGKRLNSVAADPRAASVFDSIPTLERASPK